MRDEWVILVDRDDRETGVMEKMEAHRKALLHRAVSVFIFNDKEEMLLQRRAMSKYHSPGLWTNTACTHPRPGESNVGAAERRITVEKGLKASLQKCFDFIYHAPLDNNLAEHEFDHVFCGVTNDIPQADPAEVMDYKYMEAGELLNDIQKHPENYTVWFRKIACDVLCNRKSISDCE